MSMDVISYGIANKAAKDEKNNRNNVLGLGVEGTFPHVKDRIDSLENSIQAVVAQANKLIVNDTINIMKANAKFNVVAKTARYKHQNMVFEDFLDASGIDAARSSGYVLDTTNGLVKASGSESYTIVTTMELADAVPEKAVLVVEEYLPPSISAIPTKMTANSSNGLIASASNEFFPAYKAFDGDTTGTNGKWYASGSGLNGRGWLKLDFGAGNEKIIGGYSLMNTPTANAPAMVKSWQFEGSNDGINWTTLDSQSNQTNWGASEKRYYYFQNSTAYRYYRLNITANNGDNSNMWIQEVDMFLSADGTIQGKYSISRDDGFTWEPITPETLFYFTAKSSVDKKIRLKAELPASVQLLNYGLTWS
jgi:hypothetical protein